MGSFILNKICYGAWLLTVFLAHWCTVIRNYFRLLKSQLENNVSSSVEFARLIKQLPKQPSHVALAFQYDPKTMPDEDNPGDLRTPGLDLQMVAKVTAWVAAAGTKHISLYDKLGTLKLNHKALQEEICKALERFTGDKMPSVVCHQHVNGNGCHGATGDIHVFLKSRSDGKPKLLNVVTDIFDGDFSIDGEKIKETDVNAYLFKPCCANLKGVDVKGEPDLMMIFGAIKATLDFPPWHIRLTELHWLPRIDCVQLQDVLVSFYKFAKCEQRFGK